MPHEVLLAAAFSAGVVVIFSPCAAALLPAYLSYYLAREQAEPSEATESAPRALTFDLVAIAMGLVILILAVVDRVLTFGDRTFLDGVLAVVGFVFVTVGVWHLYETKALMEPLAFARLQSQLLRGLVFGGAASLGIAGVYMALGLVIRLGFSSLVGFLPWIAFGTALIVVVLGVLMLLGVPMLSYTVPMQGFRSKTLPGFVLFGAGYGLVASGCFLPVFLQVIAASLALEVGEALQVLVVYALGSAAIFLLLSVSAAAAQGATVRWLRALRRYVPRVAGAVVVATGTYVLWYDWTFLLSRGI